MLSAYRRKNLYMHGSVSDICLQWRCRDHHQLFIGIIFDFSVYQYVDRSRHVSKHHMHAGKEDQGSRQRREFTCKRWLEQLSSTSFSSLLAAVQCSTNRLRGQFIVVWSPHTASVVAVCFLQYSSPSVNRTSFGYRGIFSPSRIIYILLHSVDRTSAEYSPFSSSV